VGWPMTSPFILCCALVLACCQQTSSVTTRADAIAHPQVVFQVGGGKRQVVPVEVAESSDDRARGLMFRDELDPGSGMLFVFDDEAVQRFWMKNTYIPLDMIFINGSGLVVGVIENVPPKTTEPRSVDIPSRYVLEVNAGFARRHGIVVGSRASIERPSSH
jgi:uncharacterized membrane protein (UPF0127 family)